MVTKQWEESVRNVEEDNTRKIFIRTGIVLGKSGGMLPQMIKPFSYFIGGPLGSGRQWLSWVHIDDATEAIVQLAEKDGLSGAFNLTAPNPVTMKEFARILGKVMKKPSWLPVPAFLLKAVFGDMSRETMLQGQKVMPKRLQELGFEFKYPGLEEALHDLVR
jgi:hypothetical protein